MLDYAFLAPFAILLPFLAFLSALLLRQSRWGARVALALLGATALLGLLLGYGAWAQGAAGSGSLPWLRIGTGSWDFTWEIGLYNGLMAGIVGPITFLVALYSTEYLRHEPHFNRYFSYLGLFSGAMMGLVLSSNLLIIYAFWELVGLASYLLIGFWQDRPAAARASQKAFLVNRVGDAGFLVALMALYALFGTLDLPEMARLLENGQAPAHPVWPWLAGIGLALGAMGKSAQLPFSVWLPDAMEGPTPVSALLHAATMVAAGVYLLARCHFLLPGSVQEALLWVGALTALYGAFSALAQTDLKKVLAFSTISQLGYMFMALGAGAPGLAMFHLLTHAFFKAGLFLGAGSVIHALHDAGHRQGLHFDAQDLRLMGGLRKALPFTAAAFALCGFSLAGLPLFSGFLSKDAILITIWEQGHWMPFILSMLAALGTAFYVGRLLFLVFWGDDIRAKGLAVGQVSEGSWAMRFPMGLLALLSAWVWFSWHPADAGSGWMLQGLGQQTAHGLSGWMIGGGSALGAVLMLALAWGIYVRGHRWKDRLFPAHSLLRRWSEQACYLPRAYQTAVALLLGLSRGSAWIDRKGIDAWIDRAGIATVVLAHIGAFLDRWAVDGLVNGTAKTIGAAGKSSLYLLQQGKVQGYIAAAMAGLLLLLSLLG